MPVVRIHKEKIMGLFSSTDSKIKWEKLGSEQNLETYRSKVPGGWLITVRTGAGAWAGLGVSFMPDPDHSWDGCSLE
jgi:hypothetical protein